MIFQEKLVQNMKKLSHLNGRIFLFVDERNTYFLDEEFSNILD